MAKAKTKSKYAEMLAKYISDVNTGKIVAGLYTKKAVKRFQSDLKRAKDADFLFSYHQDEADALCHFAEALKPGDLNGKTINLLPWQVFVLCNLEGWRHKSDRNRKRFRHAYIELARKQGKTTGILETLTLYNFLKYPASESYLVSSRDDLADKTFKEIADIIHSDKQLDAVLDCKSLAITFKDLKEKSRLGFFCDGGKDADGFRPRFFCCDEFHAFASDKMYTSMDYGMRSKTDAQGVIITTADVIADGPCYEQNLKTKRILNELQTQDDFFGVIYAIDEGDNWKNQKVWQKANPSLFDIVDPSVIQADIEDAELTPHKIPELKAKTFGIWGGGGEKSWLPVEVWQKNKDVITPYDELKDIPCYAAIDLSKVDDLSGFSLLWRYQDKEFYKHCFYIPEKTLAERYRKENVNFMDWVEKGIIKTIPGAVIDYDFILHDFLEAAEQFKIVASGYDVWQAKDLINGIEDARPDIQLIEIEQSLKKLSPIFKDYEKAVRDGRVVDNSPLSLWAMQNVEVKPDPNNNYKPMKRSKASNQHIDPIVTATMCHGVMQIVGADIVQPIDFERMLAIL